MKKAISGRQTGKTEKLIRLASETGAVILTIDKNTSNNVSRKAYDMGLAIQSPIDVNMLMSDSFQNSMSGRVEQVIVDDADGVLQKILSKFNIASVDAISLCTDDMSDELI